MFLPRWNKIKQINFFYRSFGCNMWNADTDIILRFSSTLGSRAPYAGWAMDNWWGLLVVLSMWHSLDCNHEDLHWNPIFRCHIIVTYTFKEYFKTKNVSVQWKHKTVFLVSDSTNAPAYVFWGWGPSQCLWSGHPWVKQLFSSALVVSAVLFISTKRFQPHILTWLLCFLRHKRKPIDLVNR